MVGATREPTGSDPAEPRATSGAEDRPDVSPADPWPRRRALSAGQVLVVVVVGLALAALLGAGDLLAAAEHLPHGPWRTVVLGVARPIAGVSSLLRADRPLEFIHRLRSTESDAFASRDASDVSATAETPSGPSNASAGHPASTEEPASAYSAGSTSTSVGRSGTGTPSGTPSTTAVIQPKGISLATPTVDQPLRVLVAGDSMVQQVGEALINMSDTIRTMKVKLQVKINSGLCRPDYYDWPKAMRQVQSEYAPQASVVMFGGNDAQDIAEGGKTLVVWSSEWTAAYGRRVAQVIETLTEHGGDVYWVGVPTMRRDQDARSALALNEIYKEVCSRYAQATYIDAWKLFAGDSGDYSAYLPDATGRSRLVREPDGVHFTILGGNRAAAAILKEMRTQWVLKAQ